MPAITPCSRPPVPSLPRFNAVIAFLSSLVSSRISHTSSPPCSALLPLVPPPPAAPAQARTRLAVNQPTTEPFQAWKHLRVRARLPRRHRPESSNRGFCLYARAWPLLWSHRSSPAAARVKNYEQQILRSASVPPVSRPVPSSCARASEARKRPCREARDVRVLYLPVLSCSGRSLSSLLAPILIAGEFQSRRRRGMQVSQAPAR